MGGAGQGPAGPGRLWRRLRLRLFHVCFLLTRPMTLGVRILVHDRGENAVLLVRHTYVDGWHLPGGGVETGETATEAVDRELRDETGIELTGPAELVSLHFNRRASRRDHVALYLAGPFRRAEEFRPTAEIAEVRFFPLDELPDDIDPATTSRIEEALRGRERSDCW